MLKASQKTPSAHQLAAISRLFSPSVLREVAKKGESPLFCRLLRQSGLLESVDHTRPIRDLFEIAFSLLKREGNRNEYVYKAAIAHKILLGKHSLRTASMLTEFRVGSCKADVVVLNGTSTVYEIKSERDNLDRLPFQLAEFRKVFATVNVITAECHQEQVLSGVPTDVGVLLLTRRNQIRTLREAEHLPDRTDSGAVFDSLKRDESMKILRSHGINVPNVPNTQSYRVMRELFLELDPGEAHDGLVRVLRETRSMLPVAEFIGTLPMSIKPAALAIPLCSQERDLVSAVMSAPIVDALRWV